MKLCFTVMATSFVFKMYNLTSKVARNHNTNSVILVTNENRYYESTFELIRDAGSSPTDAHHAQARLPRVRVLCVATGQRSGSGNEDGLGIDIIWIRKKKILDNK